jgi:hypothetical protein
MLNAKMGWLMVLKNKKFPGYQSNDKGMAFPENFT